MKKLPVIVFVFSTTYLFGQKETNGVGSQELGYEDKIAQRLVFIFQQWIRYLTLNKQ